jgi:hypothetical protein
VQLTAVWADQAVGPSGFPYGDGMISPSIPEAVALRLKNAVWGETHCTDVLSRPGSMLWLLFALSPVFHVALKHLRKSGRKGLDLLPDVLRTAT